MMNDQVKDIPVGKLVVGIGLVLFGLVFSFATAHQLVLDLSIWVLGKSADATVTSMDFQKVGESATGEPVFEYSISYQFTSHNGRTVTGFSTVNLDEWSNLSQGTPLIIGYFPLYPEHNRLNDTRFLPLHTTAYLAALAIAATALVIGLKLLKQAPITEEDLRTEILFRQWEGRQASS